MLRKTLFALAVSLLFMTSAYACPINVAEGADVTLHGEFGVLRDGSGWEYYDPADASTLTDGEFLPVSTTWNDGSVWWDEFVPESANNWIEIDLGMVYELVGFIVQADDNDAYLLEYWDGGTDSWVTAWDIPVVGGWGDQTRPNVNDNTDIFELGTPIMTDRLRFTAVFANDQYYSVTEIQAFAMPEPGTLALLGIGLIAMALVRRRI